VYYTFILYKGHEYQIKSNQIKSNQIGEVGEGLVLVSFPDLTNPSTDRFQYRVGRRVWWLLSCFCVLCRNSCRANRIADNRTTSCNYKISGNLARALLTVVTSNTVYWATVRLLLLHVCCIWVFGLECGGEAKWPLYWPVYMIIRTSKRKLWIIPIFTPFPQHIQIKWSTWDYVNGSTTPIYHNFLCEWQHLLIIHERNYAISSIPCFLP